MRAADGDDEELSQALVRDLALAAPSSLAGTTGGHDQLQRLTALRDRLRRATATAQEAEAARASLQAEVAALEAQLHQAPPGVAPTAMSRSGTAIAALQQQVQLMERFLFPDRPVSATGQRAVAHADADAQAARSVEFAVAAASADADCARELACRVQRLRAARQATVEELQIHRNLALVVTLVSLNSLRVYFISIFYSLGKRA